MLTPDNAPPRFYQRLAQMKNGTHFGQFRGHRYAVSITRPLANVVKLYAEELGGTDIISFNLYTTSSRSPSLKPCEMSAGKVIEFVLEFEPEPVGQRES